MGYELPTAMDRTSGTVRLVGTCNDGELPGGGGGWDWADTELSIDFIQMSAIAIGVVE